MRDDTQQQVSAVLFDYGMVLSGPASPAAWTRMRAITGLGEEPFHHAYWAPRVDYDRGTLTGEQYWREVCASAGIGVDEAALAALLDADAALWTDPNQPMIDWALRLQRAGIRTGILSNLGDHLSAAVLARLPWLAGFHHRIWSHAVKLAKPEPGIYRLAAEGLETSAAKILFIDDRQDNIDGALAAGMQAILYTTTGALLETLERRSLFQLWRAGDIEPEPAA